MLLRGIISCLYFVLINSIYASSFISGDNVTIYYSETPTNIIITGSSVGASGDIIIPDYINELPVTVISNSAFGNRSISSISLPSTINEIERYAFGECNNLVSVNIPNGVNKISYASFYSCDLLETVNLPDTIISIESLAFYNCTNLNNINIFNSNQGFLQNIGQSAFRDTGLENIIFPNSLVDIGTTAFESCNNLTSIVFGTSISNISDEAFFMCSSLDEITFTSQYPPTFGSDVFYEYWPHEWSNIKRAISGANITVPYMSVNYGTHGSLFQGLPRSGASPFSWILNEETNEVTLTDCVHNAIVVDIPQQINGNPVTALNGTFYNAYNNSPGGYLWSSAFSNIIVPSNIVHIGANTFKNYYIQSVTIPNSVTNIGNYAFHESRIRSIEIPESISTIKPYSFADTYLTNIVLPEGLLNIENYAFAYNNSLREIEIPDSVTNISDNAFYDCSDLRNLILSSNLVSIGDSVFRRSTSLSNIVFKSQTKPSYTEPGNGTTYTFPLHNLSANVPEFGTGYGVFSGTLSGYNNISIDGLTPLSYLVNADNTIIITECDIQASGDFFIPDSINGSDVIGIAEQAFDGCTLIKTIQIPESIQIIDSQAFLGCSELEKVVIDNENIVINKNAFDQCNKLNIVEFKENEFLLLFNNPSEEIPNIISLINSIIPIGKSYVTNNPSLYNLYKLSEISDLRPSSTVISTSNNASELSFALEESTNLTSWHTNQLIEVNLPVTNNIKFFRFRSF